MLIGFAQTNSPSFVGCDKIGWLRKNCWALAHHPFSASAKFDGVFMACRAQTLHPISASTKFDGVYMACRAQALHPFSVSTEFDGMKKACLAQTIHPITPSAISDGAPVQKCSNSLHPSAHSAKSDGAPAYEGPNLMERPLFTKKLPAPGTPEPEARLLTVSYILIHYLRSIPQFSKASVISPCAMTLLSPRTTVPLAAASSNIST